MSEILAVRSLDIGVVRPRQPVLPLVRGVDFSIARGEVFGLIGESGSGKTTIALAVVGLLSGNLQVAGSILLDGRELVGLAENDWRTIRGRQVSCVFQNARGSLHPLISIRAQMNRLWMHHFGNDARRAEDENLELLRSVGFPDPAGVMAKYPHQLSGGQCQRVMIALALLPRPVLLLADEPTSGLDVSIQREVLDTLLARSKAVGASVLLISHDLGVVRSVCDRLAVMYAGEVVEGGRPDTVLAAPAHPYTIGLLKAHESSGRRMGFIPGAVPEPSAKPLLGCQFLSRCNEAEDACGNTHPALFAVSTMHDARCIHARNSTAGRP